MMKYVLLVSIWIVAIPCQAQTSQQPGDAKTTGPCSPAVAGNNNQFQINCQGITKEQGKKMLGILNTILTNQLDPKAVMAKLDEILKAQHPNIQNCPNGVCVGGDNNGTATVNNFAPPERHLTQEQVRNLDAIAQSLPEDAENWLFIETVNTPEAANLAFEIMKIFKTRHKIKDLTYRLAEPGPVPKGVFVLSRPDSEHSTQARQITNALSGLPNLQYGYPADLKPPDVKIIVALD